MRAYMKSELPFLGVQAAGVREVCQLVSVGSLDEIRKLWDEAQHREEKYVAIGLSREFVSLEALPLFEHMIVTGAWWDLVDSVAIHRVGTLLPAAGDTIFAWSTHPHLWKRRAAIICQNARKADTDPALLYGCVKPNLADAEFFVRKAIGWALRERSKLAPEEVLRFVETHELSPLSRREALKRLGQPRT